MDTGQVGFMQDTQDSEDRTSWIATREDGQIQDKMDRHGTTWIDPGQHGQTQDNMDRPRTTWIDPE